MPTASPPIKRIRTQKQLAELAGVSQPTVFRALAGRPDVDPDVRQRIQVLAARHNYQLNVSARTMLTGRTNTIALLLSSKYSQTGGSYTGSLHTDLLRGVGDELERRNKHLLVARLGDGPLTDPNFMPRILREYVSDGLLINYHLDIPKRMIDLIRVNEVPAVWINVKQPENSVYPDDVAAGRLATEYLLARGHRDIAMMDYAPLPTSHYSRTDRFAGYAATMRAAGLTPRLLGVEGQNIEPQGVAFTRAWMTAADRPGAVITYNAEYAELAAHAAARAGLDVPGDLSMLAISDHPKLVIGGLPFTCVRVPHKQCGITACEMLMDKIAGDNADIPSQTAPPVWVQGESCAEGANDNGSHARN